jgi:hypothetical protein
MGRELCFQEIKHSGSRQHTASSYGVGEGGSIPVGIVAFVGAAQIAPLRDAPAGD